MVPLHGLNVRHAADLEDARVERAAGGGVAVCLTEVPPFSEGGRRRCYLHLKDHRLAWIECVIRVFKGVRVIPIIGLIFTSARDHISR
jgi:hypothetical protein